jgi:hypothetical protein
VEGGVNKPVKSRIRLWVKALESGQYKQTRATLHDKNGYCCLGVACEVFKKATGRGQWTRWKGFVVGNQHSDVYLPRNVGAWFGFENIDPQLGESCATERNDTKRDSFQTIASAIREAFLK